MRHAIRPNLSIAEINARIAASKPFDHFIFLGVFTLASPLLLSPAGRRYTGLASVFYPVQTAIELLPAMAVPYDQAKRWLPRFVRRWFKLPCSRDGVEIIGFLVIGGTLPERRGTTA